MQADLGGSPRRSFSRNEGEEEKRAGFGEEKNKKDSRGRENFQALYRLNVKLLWTSIFRAIPGCGVFICVHSGIRELHICSCCAWELFSVTSTQAELHRHKMNRLPLSALVSHKALPVTGRTPQSVTHFGKGFGLAKGNAQAIKPAAHVQTQIYLHDITRKVYSSKVQGVDTDECTRCGPRIKGNADMNDWCGLCYLRACHRTVALITGSYAWVMRWQMLKDPLCGADEAEVSKMLCSSVVHKGGWNNW